MPAATSFPISIFILPNYFQPKNLCIKTRRRHNVYTLISESVEGRSGKSGLCFFVVFLGLTLSWSASVKKSEVFTVAFALVAAGAVILTLNVLLLGRHIIVFQSLESSGALSISSGCWSLNLYAEGQFDSENNCGLCDIGLELMGSLSFHECSCEPEEKSPRPLPSLSHERLCWFSHHCR